MKFTYYQKMPGVRWPWAYTNRVYLGQENLIDVEIYEELN